MELEMICENNIEVDISIVACEYFNWINCSR